MPDYVATGRRLNPWGYVIVMAQVGKKWRAYYRTFAPKGGIQTFVLRDAPANDSLKEVGPIMEDVDGQVLLGKLTRWIHTSEVTDTVKRLAWYKELISAPDKK
jgi:hypothetical protein